MPSTFYMDISGAYGGATQYGSWSVTTPVTRYKLSSTRVDTAQSTIAWSTGSNSTLQQVLLGQFWSPPLRGGATLTGSINFMVKGYEYAAAANAYPAISVTVRSGDGSTVRGAMWATAIQRSVEYVTAGTWRAGTGTTTGSIGIASGDRIVVELGVRGDPTSSNYLNSWQIYGCSSTFSEVALSNSATDQGNPWFSFSGDFPLLTDPWTGNATSFRSLAFSVGRDIIAAPAATFFRTMSHAIQSVLSAYRARAFSRTVLRQPVAAAVGVGYVSSYSLTTTATVATFTHVAGANEVVMFGASWDAAASDLGCTLDGTVGTQLGLWTSSGRRNAIIGWNRPTSGSLTLIATWNGALDQTCRMGAVSFTNAHATAPWVTTVISNATVGSERATLGATTTGDANGKVFLNLSVYAPTSGTPYALTGGSRVWFMDSGYVGAAAFGSSGSSAVNGFGFDAAWQFTVQASPIQPSGVSQAAETAPMFSVARGRSLSRLLSWSIAPTRQLSRIGRYLRSRQVDVSRSIQTSRVKTLTRTATRSIAGGTLIYVSDSFDRANEQPLASPWFGVQYGANILLLGSHCVRGTTGGHGDSMVGYSGTFSDNQYAQFTYVRNTGYDCGPVVLGNPGGSAYAFDYYDSAWHVIKYTGVGVWSEQFSKTDAGAGPNNGDVMKLELSGSKFTCYKNAAIVATGYATSPKLTGGAPGIYMYTMMGTVNDFSGGDLSSSGAGGSNSSLVSRSRSFNRLLSWAVAPTRQLSRLGWYRRAATPNVGVSSSPSRIGWFKKKSQTDLGKVSIEQWHDDFSQPDGDPGTYYNYWGGLKVIGSRMGSLDGTFRSFDYRGSFYPPNQYVEVTVASIYWSGVPEVLLGPRFNSGTYTYYYTRFVNNAGGAITFHADPGAFYEERLNVGHFKEGDRLRVEAETLPDESVLFRAYKNGDIVATAVDTVAKYNVPSGAFVGMTNTQIDDLSQGNITYGQVGKTVSRSAWYKRRVEPSNWYNVTFTDDFNRADGTLSSPWDNWTEWQIAGSRLGQGTWEFEGARIDSVVGSNTFLSCDFSEKTSLGAYSFILGLRYQLGGANYYSFAFADTLCEIGGQTNSTFYVVQQFPVSSVGTLEPGDRVRVSAYNLDDGNVLLQAHKNGALWFSSVDSSENKKTGTGYPWVAAYHGYIDNVSAGDTGLSSPSFSVARVVTGIGVLYRNLVSYISENFSLSRSAWYRRMLSEQMPTSDSADRSRWLLRKQNLRPGHVGVYSDSFNRADGTLDSPWVILNAVIATISGSSIGNTYTGAAPDAFYYENLGSNQYVSAVVGTTVDTGIDIGFRGRGTNVNVSATYYECNYWKNVDTWQINPGFYIADALNYYGQLAPAPEILPGDRIRVEYVTEANGDVLTRVFKNEELVHSVTDGVYKYSGLGKPGVHIWQGYLDDLEVGVLTNPSRSTVSRSKSFLRTLLHSVQGSRAVSRLTRRLRSAVTQVAGTRTVQRVGRYLKSIRTNLVSSFGVSRLTRRVRTAARDAVVAASVARRALYGRTVSLVRGATSVVGRLTQGTGLFVRTIAEAISTSPSVRRFGYWSRRVSSGRAVSLALSRASMVVRTASNAIRATFSLSRVRYLVRKITLTTSRSITLSRVAQFYKRVTTTIPVKATLSRIGAVVRNAAFVIRSVPSVVRRAYYRRVVALTESFAYTASRLTQRLRRVSTATQRSFVVSRVRRVVKTAILTVSRAFSVRRSLWWRRFASSSGVVSATVRRIGSFKRVVLTLGRLQPVLYKLGAVVRTSITIGRVSYQVKKSAWIDRFAQMGANISPLASRRVPIFSRTAQAFLSYSVVAAINARLIAAIYAVKTVLTKLFTFYMQSGQATVTKTTVQKIDDVRS